MSAGGLLPSPAASSSSSVPGGKKNVATPLFLENPDGTIMEATPNCKGGLPWKRAADYGSATLIRESDGGSEMAPEADYLYSRHERILAGLLSIQLAVELLYNFVFVTRIELSVTEFLSVYSWKLNPRLVEMFFWCIFTLQLCYVVLYFMAAAVALMHKRSRQYMIFAHVCLMGIAAMVLLSYVDKFNLLLFIIKILVFIYAKFLQGLTSSLMLLPAPVTI
mmetsp:Transcript_12674/g.35051  ORF Transcript_12674/g.35051 Transcript_12674/m.35051 type:complete len:221 (-) Transcript_12674:94-756(-)